MTSNRLRINSLETFFKTNNAILASNPWQFLTRATLIEGVVSTIETAASFQTLGFFVGFRVDGRGMLGILVDGDGVGML